MVVSVTSWAQQDPIYGLYMNAPLLVNPAYAGLHKHTSISVAYRAQWSGFEGAPTTAALSAYTGFVKQRAGVGLNVIQDKQGVRKNTEINLVYGYRLPAGKKGNIIFGLQGSIISTRNDYQSLSVRDPDPVFNQNVSAIIPNVGAGLIYSEPRFFFGLSVPRILSGNVETKDIQVSYYEPHLYATLAAVIPITTSLDFKPSTLLRAAEGLPLSYDLRSDLLINKKFGVGIFTRSLNTYGLALGFFSTRKFRIAYQFELPASNRSLTGFNTHELALSINTTLFRGQDLYFKYF